MTTSYSWCLRCYHWPLDVSRPGHIIHWHNSRPFTSHKSLSNSIPANAVHYSLTTALSLQWVVLTQILGWLTAVSRHRHQSPGHEAGLLDAAGMLAPVWLITCCHRILLRGWKLQMSRCLLNPIIVDKAGAARAGAGCGWWSCISSVCMEVCDLSYAAMHRPQRTGGRRPPSLPGQGHVVVGSWGGSLADSWYHAVYTVYCVLYTGPHHRHHYLCVKFLHCPSVHCVDTGKWLSSVIVSKAAPGTGQGASK